MIGYSPFQDRSSRRTPPVPQHVSDIRKAYRSEASLSKRDVTNQTSPRRHRYPQPSAAERNIMSSTGVIDEVERLGKKTFRLSRALDQSGSSLIPGQVKMPSPGHRPNLPFAESSIISNPITGNGRQEIGHRGIKTFPNVPKIIKEPTRKPKDRNPIIDGTIIVETARKRVFSGTVPQTARNPITNDGIKGIDSVSRMGRRRHVSTSAGNPIRMAVILSDKPQVGIRVGLRGDGSQTARNPITSNGVRVTDSVSYLGKKVFPASSIDRDPITGIGFNRKNVSPSREPFA